MSGTLGVQAERRERKTIAKVRIYKRRERETRDRRRRSEGEWSKKKYEVEKTRER